VLISCCQKVKVGTLHAMSEKQEVRSADAMSVSVGPSTFRVQSQGGASNVIMPVFHLRSGTKSVRHQCPDFSPYRGRQWCWVWWWYWEEPGTANVYRKHVSQDLNGSPTGSVALSVFSSGGTHANTK
jgi:hypothetical protein